MTLRFPIRAGVAASVLAHLGLVGAVLLFAEVRPFAEVPEQRIEVDVVTADEAPPAPEPVAKTKPALELPEFKPTAESEPAAQQPPAKSEPAQKQEPAKPEPAKPEPVQKQATAPKPEPPKAEPPPPPAPTPQAQQQAQPPTPAPFPPAIAQEPDLTVKYSVALGLPTDPAFDGPAEIAADISADAVAALRQRIKSCAALPASVGPSDNVRIVLRVALLPDGRLAQEPILIEASASTKGPALMQGAIDALVKCQPYAMLPNDKYKDWKLLDIGFTPQDFRGG
ncbi:conserved hypothetical protein [Rhodopseudomonas palustris HaA2]|uniref:Cell envelope biogenesis protein TolA n=1 Tax=Rhodopseudomonas palustris (strain HaA2) TaxID=316058 RepID=Q2IZH2_RHOP2|nr:hypothetical protein [Rhodopseudomonas palustris]ABD06388.1 conserved hypothetical protein [Rhodopseudomonas palustris HaA2]